MASECPGPSVPTRLPSHQNVIILNKLSVRIRVQIGQHLGPGTGPPLSKFRGMEKDARSKVELRFDHSLLNRRLVAGEFFAVIT